MKRPRWATSSRDSSRLTAQTRSHNRGGFLNFLPRAARRAPLRSPHRARTASTCNSDEKDARHAQNTQT
eukprot:1097902-Pleurochrysis_carterae.AAC.3